MYNEKIIDEIKDKLLSRQQTIAVAESVTAGHLQAALASAENASKCFQGGITAYNIGQKTRHLHVEPIHAEQCNCVSEKVAVQMGLEVTQLFTSDWGIAITGYAAPVPECAVDELFAFYAVTFRGKVAEVRKIKAATEPPMKVQIFYVNEILKTLLRLLNQSEDQSSFSINERSSTISKFASAGPLSTSPSTE